MAKGGKGSSGGSRVADRSAATGRFVSKKTIGSRPTTTYKETVKKGKRLKGKPAAETRSVTATVVPARDRDERVWHIVSDGHRKTLRSSASSRAAIKEATVLYATALKRLADR